MGLFSKAAIFTDIHVGEKLDSEQHNIDCLNFIQWFIQQVRIHNCTEIFFLGDFFHNKIRTENRTAYYGRLIIELLNDTQLPIYWLLGNHDIYYPKNRDIFSLGYMEKYTNIKLITEITQIEDVVFAPWMVNQEYHDLIKLKSKYTFAHLELPFFLVNQSIEKKYDGGLKADDFTNTEAVYSGHYHKKQTKRNSSQVPIFYLGNCFGHNFNDANDYDRGMSILEYGEILPTQIKWEDAPTYTRMKISELFSLLENNHILHPNTTLELIADLDISSEDIKQLKSIMPVRDVRLKKIHKTSHTDNISDMKLYDSFDHMIIDKLEKLNYDNKYDNNLLVSLYKSV